MSQTKWRDRFYKEREAIEAECVRRMETGERDYAAIDMTARVENLMGRDLITEAIQELLDFRNYADAMIIKLKIVDRALEYNSDVQKVLPSGKAKVATEHQSCNLSA